MEMTTIELRKLVAAEGHTLFDGETLSKEIYLGSLDRPENWLEITDEEAAEIQAKMDAEAEKEMSE